MVCITTKYHKPLVTLYKNRSIQYNSALFSGDTDFYSNATTITNREYEEREQDKKRQIKLLDPSFH